MEEENDLALFDVTTLAYHQRRHAITRWWLALYKMSHGCQHVYDDGRVCGWCEDPCGLTFDHTDGKSARMPNILSIPRALQEIRRHRCVVLCANHHNMKTKRGGEWKGPRTS